MIYSSFVKLNYSPKPTDLICTFKLKPTSKISIKEAAGAVAAESSVGTWTKVTTETPRIKKLSAKVFSIKGNKIKIAYPQELFEPGNMPQIFSSIAGNIFGMKILKSLRLEEVKLPKKIINSFPGPYFGIAGVRKLLKIKKRPLCGTIIKPKLGLNEAQHAKIAYKAWIGGIDIVKDDENLTSQSFNNFKKRLKLTLRARERAEKNTGERKVYMPNISAEYNEMLRRAELVKKLGGEYVMIDILTVGWSALQAIRKENLKLIIHAHRAMHAAFTRNKNHGISMLVLADAAKLCGVDQLHIGTIVGKMEAQKEEVIELAKRIKPVFPVCSGGLHPGLVPYLIKTLGKDIIIQAGGGVHGHPRGTTAGAKAMRQAIDAVMKNIPLTKYAKTHPELALAIKKWH